MVSKEKKHRGDSARLWWKQGGFTDTELRCRAFFLISFNYLGNSRASMDP